MDRLHQQALLLRNALQPLAEFARRRRETLDPADARAASQFRFVQDVEAALTATANYFDAADAILNPPPSPLAARVLAHLQQAHLQARTMEPLPVRQLLASITAHHLPRPDFPDEFTQRHPPEPAHACQIHGEA